MFDTRQGAYTTHTAKPRPAGADTRDAAYRALRADPDALSPMQRRLLELYLRAARYGVTTRTKGTLRNFTDMEAARWLRCERSTICGRRNELIEMKYVEKAGTRPCKITGRVVTAWRAVPQLEL